MFHLLDLPDKLKWVMLEDKKHQPPSFIYFFATHMLLFVTEWSNRSAPWINVVVNTTETKSRWKQPENRFKSALLTYGNVPLILSVLSGHIKILFFFFPRLLDDCCLYEYNVSNNTAVVASSERKKDKIKKKKKSQSSIFQYKRRPSKSTLGT